MRIITPASLAKDVPEQWAHQYRGNNHSPDKYDTTEMLKALGDNATVTDVNRIIGNESWTRTKCDECSTENLPVLEIGQAPDYESSTAHICKSCILKAADMLQSLVDKEQEQ